jgi:hypothetical protein
LVPAKIEAKKADAPVAVAAGPRGRFAPAAKPAEKPTAKPAADAPKPKPKSNVETGMDEFK